MCENRGCACGGLAVKPNAGLCCGFVEAEQATVGAQSSCVQDDGSFATACIEARKQAFDRCEGSIEFLNGSDGQRNG